MSGPAGVRIVLVEDNPADVYLIRIALREAGLEPELTIFEDGAAALAYLREENSPVPHLFILDVNVPKTEGTELLVVIRAHPRFTAIPVMALSSSAAQKDMEKARMLGADRYVTKPADFDEFMKVGAAIREVLEGFGGRTTSGQ